MPLSEETLREFEKTLREIREAVDQGDSVLRSHSLRKAIAWLALLLGLAILLFFLAARFLGTAQAAQESLWLTGTLVAFILAIGTVKFIVLGRIMKREHGTIATLLRMVYGKRPGIVVAASGISMGAVMVWCIVSGNGPLAIPLSAMFGAIASLALDMLVNLPEYKVFGGLLLTLGLLSLFFAAGDPLLWAAIVWAVPPVGMGVAALLDMRKR